MSCVYVKISGQPAAVSSNRRAEEQRGKQKNKNVRNSNEGYLQGNADRLQDKDTESLTEEKGRRGENMRQREKECNG